MPQILARFRWVKNPTTDVYCSFPNREQYIEWFKREEQNLQHCYPKPCDPGLPTRADGTTKYQTLEQDK